MSYQDILPDVNIENIRENAKKRTPGGGYILSNSNTEKLLHDALSEIKRCVGPNSIYREFILIQLQDDGEIREELYPGANILNVVAIINNEKGFDSRVVKRHILGCKCGENDPPCTKWLKIINNWDQ